MIDAIPIRFARLSDITAHLLLVTIGDNRRRASIQRAAQSLGLELTTFIADPANYFADAPEPGSMILAGAVVNVGTTIGAGVIVNTSAVVEHDCRVGDFVHISPGARVTGGCEIGDGTQIGAGAILIPQLVIAPGTVIGAGSTVIHNISERGIYVGIPARRIH